MLNTMLKRAQILKLGITRPASALVLLLLIVTVNGCRKNTSTVADTVLAETARTLAQASSPANTNASLVSQARDAYKAGDYEAALGNMNAVIWNTNKSSAQTIAVQGAMAALMTDLYSRAAKGDAAAQQAIKDYQAMQNQRRVR